MDAKLMDRSGTAVTVLLLPEFGAGQVPGIVEFAGRMFVLGDADGRPSSCLAEAHYYEALVYQGNLPTEQNVPLHGGQPVELASAGVPKRARQLRAVILLLGQAFGYYARGAQGTELVLAAANVAIASRLLKEVSRG